MPKVNRRLFLQMAGAAGLAPAIPALPAGGLMANGATSTSKMLWASMGARAGNASHFAGIAGSLGVPPKAALGVYSKLGAKQVLATGGMARVARSARPRPVVANTATPSLGAGLKASPGVKSTTAKAPGINLRKMLADDLADDEAVQVEKEGTRTESLQD